MSAALLPEFRFRRAAEHLRAGQLVAHPTAGVWGLACDPENKQAVMHLLATKGRSIKKGLILLADNRCALEKYVQAPAQVWAKAEATWPGPHTWLMPAKPSAPYWLTGGRRTIAVRVSKHPIAAHLAQVFGGAIISTSANLSGHPAGLSSWQVASHLRNKIAYQLGGTLTRPGQPSSITDAMTGTIIR